MRFGSLYKRELLSFVATPIAWVVGFVFTLVPAFVFLITDNFIALGRASLRGYFDWFPLMFTLVIPALTMRSWAEEKDKGSQELLLTLPLKIWEFVLGKFLAVLTIVGAFLVLTIPLPLMVLPLGSFDIGEILTEYLGSFLLAATTISLGLLISLLTSNQIVALVLGVISILALTFIGRLPSAFPMFEGIGDFLRFLSLEHHFQSFHRGILDSRDGIYFLLTSFLFLYLNTKILLARKWR